MNISRITVSLIACLILCSNFVHGQTKLYNINSYSGLPTNHVYNMMRDKLGYLWITTPKGIVKYNGYEFKTLGLLNGMANDDVWALHEDNKGRIWLHSISKQIGYVHNNKYRKAYTDNLDLMFYPDKIYDYNTGVIFLSKGYLCLEKNDTIARFDPKKYFRCNSWHLHKDGSLILEKDNYLYKAGINKTKLSVKKLCRLKDKRSKPLKHCILFNSYFVKYTVGGNIVDIVDIHNGSHRTVTFEDEHLHTPHNEKNQKLYFITDKTIYGSNEKVIFTDTFSINQLLQRKQLSPNDIVFLLEDDLWGSCLATNFNGIYLSYDTSHFQSIAAAEHTKYKCVGYSPRRVYLWDEFSNTLASIDTKKKIHYENRGHIKNVRRVISYNKDSSFIVTKSNFYWLDQNTKKITNVQDGISKNYTIETYNNNTRRTLIDSADTFPIYAVDVVVNSPRDLYVLSKGTPLANCRFAKDSMLLNFLSATRFNAITYDSSQKTLWAYNSEEILVYDSKKNKQTIIDKYLLNKLNIKKIEQIVISSYTADVFIKDYDKIFVYNYANNTYKELFKEYGLVNSRISLQDDILLVAGRFGVLFNKISDHKQVMFRNSKSKLYNDVIDLMPLGKHVLLHTDKGFFTTSIPADSTFRKGNNTQYLHKLVLDYNNDARNIQNGDTIIVDQKNPLLEFDLINPLGVGNLKYKYTIKEYDPQWNTLGTNQLHLPKLRPDNFYTLSLIALDDVWKSKKINIILYIQPYWWETNTGKRILGFSGVAMTFLLVFFIIYLTKKIVTRKHLQKSLRLEMELKSIYSQINPHFIFNTLNTGLFFIKKKKTEEAYEHISAFSDLLRSYIKSSRDKFITIKEEIENLKNYIILQQARFTIPFEYQIILNEPEYLNNLKIPSLLLQPLVENAITHGLFHKEGQGNLIIEFKMDRLNNALVCIIDDDGVGRTASKLMYEQAPIKTQSYGTELIKDLIKIFNTYEDTDIAVEYIDKEFPEMGTTVILTIKNLRHEV